MKIDFERAKAIPLEKRHPGKHIKTKNGFVVKILSWDVGNIEYPICALVKDHVYQYDTFGNIENKSYRDTLNLVLDIPDKPKKISKLKTAQNKIKHSFSWRPVSEIAKDLDEPIIFLTDKGKMITHSKLRGPVIDGKNINLFNRYKCYANAVAWVYQKDLFDIEKFM